MTEREPINWSLLGGLRFFLATIVAFSHTLWFDIHSGLAVTITSLGAKAAVVGFLLVSGFSIAASLDRDERHFYFRRFKRIYPLYFPAVLSAVVLQVWLGEYHLPNYTLVPAGWVAIVGNFLLVQTFLVQVISYNGVLWSLAVEVSYYVLSPTLRRLPLVGLTILVAISAAFYLLPMRTDLGIAYTLLLKANAVKYCWPFLFGFALYFNRSAWLFVGLLVLGTALVWTSEINYERFAPLTFAISMIVIRGAQINLFPHWRTLEYLGDISYPLYVFQIPIYIFCYAAIGLTAPALLYGIAIVVAVVALELIDVRLKIFLFKLQYPNLLAYYHRTRDRGRA